MRGKNWEAEDRLQAAYTYVLTGSVSQTSQVTTIPERTIKSWLQESWFQLLMDEAKERKNEELIGKWTGLVHKIVEKIEERVEKGDAILNKYGELVYIPVKARDLALVQGIVTDKLAQNKKLESKRPTTIDDSRLNKLQKTLEGGTVVDDEEIQQ